MTEAADRLEWRYLRNALVLVALVAAAVLAGWTVHEIRQPAALTRLEQVMRCLNGEKGLATVVPARDPLAASAGEGSLETTVEGNDVTVSLASSEAQAAKIERYYRTFADELAGRLERRQTTVYLWRFRSSPTQRQAMYDCQY
jgi:hypothetical protein